MLGYALLGAGRSVLKSEDALRSWARGRIPMLTRAVVAVLIIPVVIASFDWARMIGSLFLDRPWGLNFPLIGIIAIVGIFAGVHLRHDSWTFVMTVMLFVAAFLSLAVMFWPYIIPYNVTVVTAAAPEASLSFLFWGGACLFVLPVFGVYTAAVYWAFRGKQRAPPSAVKRS
jgi:cytochrome d ubiquinol oxidase subunit II